MDTWWNILQKARKVINENPPITLPDGELPIRTNGGRKQVEADLKWFFDLLSGQDSEGWKCRLPADLPASILPWYEKEKANERRGWWKYHRDLTPRLIALNNLNALKMFIVYCDHMNNSNIVNSLGLAPGETCIGAKTLAAKAGVSEGYLWKGNRILAQAGLVSFVRRLWFNGPYVHKVNTEPGPEPKEESVSLRL